MPLDPTTRQRIADLVASDRVVLFMKGTRTMPQCGFSATTIGILDALLPNYNTVNVLEDQQIREGIKEFSEWPTIPQLYIDKEFVGGCDIVKQMFNSGDLHQTLGVEPPDRTPPEIALMDSAVAMMRSGLQANPGLVVHLQIDGRWQHNFTLGPAEGHEVVAESNGISIHMDPATAQKARGLRVDVTENLQGTVLQIENPNSPPPVLELQVEDLKGMLDAGQSVNLFDVRQPEELQQARIEGARLLDKEAVAMIEALPKDAPLVFQCHHGQRSQGAAEHFRLQGHRRVYNLVGGIDAWSQRVDPGVPRY